MQSNSLFQHLKSIYCFTINEPKWKEYEIKTHVQLSSNTIKLLMFLLILAFLVTGKGLINSALMILVFSFLLIVTNEKTLTAMKFFTMALSFGIPWVWMFIVGKESILFNHIYTVFAPITVLVFTGSYTLTSLCYVYTITFGKFSADYIIQEFQQSPALFEKMFYYYIHNSHLANFFTWAFFSFMFYHKQALCAQLWYKQKETEDLFKQVQKKNEELERLNLDSNRFFLSLSHEFRNPINAALGNLELASEKITDPIIQKFIANSRTSIGLLFHLVSNLLDAHKIEAGSLEWNEVQQDSRKLFSKVWNISKKLLDKNNLIGEFYVHKLIPKMIVCDSHYLIQGILNIVFNAIKYTQQGGVMVVLSWLPRVGPPEDHLKPTEVFLQRFQSTILNARDNKIAQSLDLSLVQKYHSEPLQTLQFSRSESEIENAIPGEYDNVSESFLLKEKLFVRSSIELIESFRYTVRQYERFSNISTDPASYTEEMKEEPRNEEKGYLKIEVFDSGRGIDDNMKEHLFKKYSALHSKGEERLGLGLGMWTTKTICESRGGKLKAFSETNKGSQFIAVIPMESGAMKCSPVCARLRRMSTTDTISKLSAYIVDDDKYNREISSVFLSKVGILVRGEAVNGQEAVEVLTSKPSDYCDFVLMDLEMPVMNGKEAVKKIREFETLNQRIPMKVVIATGNVDRETYSECMDLNGEVRADLFYRKPLKKRDFEEIAEIIQKDKLQQSTCIIVNGETVMNECIQKALRKHKVHTFCLDSVEKSEGYIREYQSNLRWVLIQLNQSKDKIGEILKIVDSLDAKVKPEIIGFGVTLDSDIRTYCEVVGIDKIFTSPLNPDEIDATFNLQ